MRSEGDRNGRQIGRQRGPGERGGDIEVQAEKQRARECNPGRKKTDNRRRRGPHRDTHRQRRTGGESARACTAQKRMPSTDEIARRASGGVCVQSKQTRVSAPEAARGSASIAVCGPGRARLARIAPQFGICVRYAGAPAQASLRFPDIIHEVTASGPRSIRHNNSSAHERTRTQARAPRARET